MRRRGVGTVEETPWWLAVNGERAAHGTATPNRLESLAAGRLLAEGYIATAADIESLTIVYDPPGCVGLRARVPADRAADAQRRRAHCDQHGCGARCFLGCDRDALPARDDRVMPPSDAFPELFRLLFRAADQYGHAGGMHAASLTDGTELLEPFADVGRHNAVDKAIGWAVLERVDRSMLGLVLTARVSAAIAVKAARAGLAWVASRSIPTDLAVEIATASQLPIVARAAGKDARIFGVPPSNESLRDAPPEWVRSKPPPSQTPPAGGRGLVARDDSAERASAAAQPLPDEGERAGDSESERAAGRPGEKPVTPDAV